MRLLIGSYLFLCSTLAFAWSSPQQALDEFLKFELAGGRLAAWDFKKYLAVDKNYDDPGWDEIHLVKQHRVIDLKCTAHECLGRVEISFAPTQKLTADQLVPHPKGGKALLRYHVVKKDKQWLLTHAGGQPLVDIEVYRRWKAQNK